MSVQQELLRILSDGNWHSTRQLIILAGEFIRPEIAYRKSIARPKSKDPEIAIRQGQGSIIKRILYSWRGKKLEHRLNSGRAEWRLRSELEKKQC